MRFAFLAAVGLLLTVGSVQAQVASIATSIVATQSIQTIVQGTSSATAETVAGTDNTKKN